MGASYRGVVWPSESPLCFLEYYRDIGRLNKESVCTQGRIHGGVLGVRTPPPLLGDPQTS